MDKQTQYIGARYTTKIYENSHDPSSAEWEQNVDYEPLTMVTFNRGSYLSKKYVPATVGNPADNPLYWIKTGDYNGQIAHLEQEVNEIIEALENETVARNNADNTLRNSLTAEKAERINEDNDIRASISQIIVDLNAEIINRSDADSSLSSEISEVETNLASETSARTSADSNLQTQINQIIAPSGEAPSAAEVENARIAADSNVFTTLGGAIRTVTSIERLFPFEGSIDTKLLHPTSSASVYNTKSAGIKKLCIKAKTPAAYKDFYLINLYAYHASLHKALFTIRSSDNAIAFNYQSEARASSDPTTFPTEEITCVASDGSVLTATIDWSKINLANGVNIPNGSTGFKIFDGCVEYVPNTDINRLYPFDVPIDSVLRHPTGNAVIYNAAMCGIKKLHIETANDGEFYLTNLYAYHASAHISLFSVANKANTVVFTYRSEARASSSDLPTENITLTAADGSKLTATIDWSKINLANGVNIPLGSADFRISESTITRNKGYCKFVPINDYYVTGEQQRIYINEIAEYNKSGFFVIGVSGANSTEVTTSSNDNGQYIEFNMNSNKDVTITLDYYYDFSKLETHTIVVHSNVTAELPPKKYMFIGDSLTDAGVYIKQFSDLNVGKVTSYGTRETNGVHHEGRSGWSSNNYVNDATVGGIINPFYNPSTEKFDFNYYMTNNPSFNDVDCVVIFLGRNDGYTSSVIENLNTMLDSILDFNGSIETFVIGAYNVAENNTGIGQALMSCYTLNHGANNYNRRFFYPTFNQTTDTKAISVELNLDNEYDYSTDDVAISNVDSRTRTVYTDTVHPSSIGYKKFGYALSSYFRNLFA